jgi:DDE superfamily endonuclease
MHAWDEKLDRDGKKVLVYLDNCSVHPPESRLKNIELQFLPVNTTAKSQVNLNGWQSLILAVGPGYNC